MVIPVDDYKTDYISPSHRDGNPKGLPSGNSSRKTLGTDKKRKREDSGISQSSAFLVPVTLDLDREPWERQNAERLHYYRWFQIYLELSSLKNERSIRAAWTQACVQYGGRIATRTFNHAAKVWRWKERAEAWDEYTFRVSRDTYVKTLEQVAARQARRGVVMASVGAAIINRLRTKLLERGNNLALRDLVKLFRPAMEAVQTGQREERLARGFQTSIALPSGNEEDAFDRVLSGLELEASPEVEEALNQLEEVLIEKVTIERTTRRRTKPRDVDSIEGEYQEMAEQDHILGG
jgi:hypothetical protein